MSKNLNHITIGRGNGIVLIADKALDVSLVNNDTIQIKLPPQDEHPVNLHLDGTLGVEYAKKTGLHIASIHGESDRVFKARLDIASKNLANLAKSKRKLEEYAADGEAQRLANLWNVTPIGDNGAGKESVRVFDIKNHRLIDAAWGEKPNTKIPSIRKYVENKDILNMEDADIAKVKNLRDEWLKPENLLIDGKSISDWKLDNLYQFVPDEQNKLTLEGRSGFVRLTHLDGTQEDIYLNDGDSIDAGSVKRMEWVGEAPTLFEHLTYGKHYQLVNGDGVINGDYDWSTSNFNPKRLTVFREFDHWRKAIIDLVIERIKDFWRIIGGVCYAEVAHDEQKDGTIFPIMDLGEALKLTRSEYKEQAIKVLIEKGALII